MNEPTHELEAYFVGNATEEQFHIVEAWINADPANARALMEQQHFRELLGEHLREQADSTISVLKELAQFEAQAEVVSVPVMSAEDQPCDPDDTGSISVHDWLAAGSYLLRHTFTPKVTATLATAAALLLGVTLLIVLSGGEPDETMTVETPDQSPAVQNAVATLTAEHDATWAEGALAPGSPLRAGQRLTLTAGFAEITTAQGAVAILQAPATVELTDSNNALRLHTGKLVGICETDSSKGFVVRTAALDITDLGTRFGVDATHAGTTEVHVFEGEVRIAREQAGLPPIRPTVLTQGQAVRADVADSMPLATAITPDRFRQNLGVRLLAGTGNGQQGGEADRIWRVVAVDGQPVTEHGEMIIVPEHHAGHSSPATSQWLLIDEALNPPGRGSAVFTCRASFRVPPTFNSRTHELTIRCQADFSVRAVRVNGQAINVPGNRIGNGWVTLTVTDHVSPGENTIEIDVLEYLFDDGRRNSSSLRVQIEAG